MAVGDTLCSNRKDYLFYDSLSFIFRLQRGTMAAGRAIKDTIPINYIVVHLLQYF